LKNNYQELIKLLPKRKVSGNKASYGKALIIAGSTNYAGAAILTIRSAYRIGTGMVYAAVPKSISTAINLSVPEAIIIGLAETKSGSIAKTALNKILEKVSGMNSIVIGPGLSNDPDTFKLVISLLKALSGKKTKPIVILDADGLNALGQNPKILKALKLPLILTPHPKEMERLTKMTVNEIQTNRSEIASRFSKANHLVLVLKGAGTVIAGPKGEVSINPTGNPVLSTAGTGDILSGIIAGLAAQGLSAGNAAKLGVYLHGLAGDAVKKNKGERGIIATDIVEALPSVLQSVR